MTINRKPKESERDLESIGGVELFLFDLDGTLADTKADLAAAVNLTFFELGLPELQLEVIAGYIGDGVRKLIGQSLGEEGTPRHQEALRLFRTHYLDHLMDTTQLYPGMRALLERFSDTKKVVVTNKPMEYTTPIVHGLDVLVHFDDIIGSEPGIPLKPDPTMIHRALERTHTLPSRAVMIGDGINDILAARAAAVYSCAVGYGLSSAEELQAAGPDYFCDDMEALMLFLGRASL